MKKEDRLIVALDCSRLEDARKLIENLKGIISFYKIGLEFFVSCGWEAIDLVHQYGGRVFLDLKLHDIPNTVKRTIRSVCDHDVQMVNVHALGGYDMMRETCDVVGEYFLSRKNKPIVIGVTILTSHSSAQLSQEIGISVALGEEVLKLARLVKKAGLDGVVSSPQEVVLLRKEFPRDFYIVTPGVRPVGSAKGDQQRICTPQEALAAGADYLVIGRPITASSNPRESALEIIRSIN